MIDDNLCLVFYGGLMHNPPDGMTDDIIREMHSVLLHNSMLDGDAVSKVVRMAFEHGREVEKILGDKEKAVLIEKSRDDFDEIIKLELKSKELQKDIESLKDIITAARKNMEEMKKSNTTLLNKVNDYEHELKKMGYKV